MEAKRILMDIVGDLDKNDVRDRFKIMQNREAFDFYLFSCLIYLFSEHVGGFFDAYSLHAIIDKKTSLFKDKEAAAADRSAYVLSLFDQFDFIEYKIIDKDIYVRSTIGNAGFSHCFSQANKFCKDFEQILDMCLDVFKEWIVYKENNESDKRRAT